MLLCGVLGAALVSAAPARAITLPPQLADALVADVGAPTALAFTPAGRLLITTQGGALYVYQGASLLRQAALTLTSLCSSSERGLLAVAVDPAFASNHSIYLYYTFRKPSPGNTAAHGRRAVGRRSRH